MLLEYHWVGRRDLDRRKVVELAFDRWNGTPVDKYDHIFIDEATYLPYRYVVHGKTFPDGKWGGYEATFTLSDFNVAMSAAEFAQSISPGTPRIYRFISGV